MYMLFILGLIITIVADVFVRNSYNKYRKIKNNSGLTGFEVARKILDKNGLEDIHIVETRGELTDHYDPKSKVVRLSNSIFNGDTIAAASVAAHECGHAIQDKDNYTFMRIRASLVPFVNFSSKFGYLVLMIGFLAGSFDLVALGLGLLIVILLFQLVTLPVEFNASKRAKIQLDNMNILIKEEIPQSSRMLRAAAFTYVASLVTTLLEILRLALVIFGNRD